MQTCWEGEAGLSQGGCSSRRLEGGFFWLLCDMPVLLYWRPRRHHYHQPEKQAVAAKEGGCQVLNGAESRTATSVGYKVVLRAAHLPRRLLGVQGVGALVEEPSAGRQNWVVCRVYYLAGDYLL